MIGNSVRRCSLVYSVSDFMLEMTGGTWEGQVIKHSEIPTILKKSKLQVSRES